MTLQYKSYSLYGDIIFRLCILIKNNLIINQMDNIDPFSDHVLTYSKNSDTRQPDFFNLVEPYKFAPPKRGKLIDTYPNGDGSWQEVREGVTLNINFTNHKIIPTTPVIKTCIVLYEDGTTEELENLSQTSAKPIK